MVPTTYGGLAYMYRNATSPPKHQPPKVQAESLLVDFIEKIKQFWHTVIHPSIDYGWISREKISR